MAEGSRLTLNVVFLLLLVFYGNAALKEYTTVTELSPGRLFHLLVLPAGSQSRDKFCTQYEDSRPNRPSPSMRKGSGEEQERPTVLPVGSLSA